MNYEEWDKHTTELQNRYGYAGKPKPTKGALAETSVYEFVNDWLPKHLVWEIMTYVIAPHVPKKVIADHYNGIGQRHFGLGVIDDDDTECPIDETESEWFPHSQLAPHNRATAPYKKWLPRVGNYTIVRTYYPHGTPLSETVLQGNRRESVLTPENRMWGCRELDTNKLVTFLKATHTHTAGRDYVKDKNGKKVSKCKVLIALQDNKVKGRTQLYKNYQNLERLTPEEQRAIFDAMVNGILGNYVRRPLNINRSAHAAVMTNVLMKI